MTPTPPDVTSFLFLPELGVSVEDQARAALFPLQLNLLLEEPLTAPLLPCHILVQRFMPLPFLTPVIILWMEGQVSCGSSCPAPCPLIYTVLSSW